MIHKTMLLSGDVLIRLSHRFDVAEWRMRNSLRWLYIWGYIQVMAARFFGRLFGFPVITSELCGRLIQANGQEYDLGVMSRRVITSAGVGFLVDAWQNLVELENMKYHGVGTGTTAESSAQTALVTECTTALNPDSTRATGTQTEFAANVLQSVGTLTFDGTAAVTEHGLFSQAATGGGVLFDRSLFSSITVVSGDSLQLTYRVSFTAGG